MLRANGSLCFRCLLLAALHVGATVLLSAAIGPVDSRVRVNSVGFTPDATKRATVAAPGAAAFRVVRIADDVIVHEGVLGPQQTTAATDTNETVRVAEFSALRTAGQYQLDVPGIGRSAVFSVATDVWNEPYRLVARGLYLWRCGTEVTASWQGQTFHHAACHLGDAWLDYVGGGHVHRDGTGGWHDAGDYNKYVVNAGVSVGLIFKAWEHFRAAIGELDLALPESGNGLPDILNELRWELDWLRTMQAADGRVYHKLSARDFGYWGAPEFDPSPRYFVPWGSTATADFVAMMALAARHFAEFDPAYADQCLAAARAAWAVLVVQPANVPPNQAGFSTGGYDADDGVHRLWAAAEMWTTTEETAFLTSFEQRAATQSFTTLGPTWGDVRDLGLGTYLENESAARDAALVGRLRTNLLARATAIRQTINDHAYGRGLGGGNWFWGANGSVAAQTYLLHVADRLEPDPGHRRAAEATLGFLFGRNFHNRSYVTGLGHAPPLHPHDRRGEPAWPGYLVGGGWPTGRSWQDVQADYEQNEIALNWNASLIYALAALAQPENPVPEYAWATFEVGQPGTYAPELGSPAPTSFTATGLPHWASIDAATGVISGTPGDDPATPEFDPRASSVVTLQAFQGDELMASRGINLLIAEPGTDIGIVNLSARASVGVGENVLIAGFVVSGTEPRPLLLRGIGPALGPHGVAGFLVNPVLTLFADDSVLLANDDWSATPDAAAISGLATSLNAFPLDNGSADAALLATLPPGAFTAHISGAPSGGTVALAEIYDGAPGVGGGRLENISARAWVSGGEAVLISGVVLTGGGSARILVRAIGPTLTDHGVLDPLTDPVLTVFSGATILAINDDWSRGDAAGVAASAVAVHAFALPENSRDAALVAPLVAGAFTIQVDGKYGEAGVTLVELYLVP